MEELSHIQQMVSLFVRFMRLEGRFCVCEKKKKLNDAIRAHSVEHKLYLRRSNSEATAHI